MPIAAVTDVRYNDQGIASGPVFTGQQLADATLTPRLAEAHPQAQVANQALLSDFRPALLLAAAFAFLGALVLPLSRVDNSAFSPTGLTIPLDPIYPS